MWSPVFFGLIFCFVSESIVEGKHTGCFNDHEHGLGRPNKWLRAWRDIRYSLPKPVNHASQSCAAFQRELSHKRSSSDLSHRSLSPWRTRTVVNHDMFPSTYEEAECLCDGCIINGAEDMTYNSVPVQQTRLFLKKVKCESDPSKYSLEYERVSVKVACTCVVPRN